MSLALVLLWFAVGCCYYFPFFKILFEGQGICLCNSLFLVHIDEGSNIALITGVGH